MDACRMSLFALFAFLYTVSATDRLVFKPWKSQTLNRKAASIYNVDDSQGLGRQFDGIGGLSGGGATSKLLVNYPEKQRDEILDYLFKPNFGASLHILKVEIGGDAQSTEGTEASHMHNSWDENYQRGYEWWIMTEAKKRNPDIKLYGLPWAWPGWIGNGTRNPYHNPAVAASYIIKWIQGAKQHYNLTIDYIGIWNEKDFSIKYTETLRKSLDASGLKHVQIVAPDGSIDGVSLLIKLDAKLSAAVSTLGAHYPGTNSSKLAKSTGKQLWASEDYSTFNDNVGAGCWARILNQNYVNGYMTSTISWNLIASYYENLPYAGCGLMTAESPWSGNYVVESPIWISAHTTQFTKPGWKYLIHDHGVGHLKNGGSYVSLTDGQGGLTIIIETMSHNHSLCIRPSLPPYNVTNQNVTLQLGGRFANIASFNVWYTKLGFDNKTSTLFHHLGKFPTSDGMISIELGIDEVFTLTTIEGGEKGSYDNIPDAKPFPLPYMEDFESYDEHNEPYNFAQQTGSFEVLSVGNPTNKVLTQMVSEPPCSWCQAENGSHSISLAGNYSWADIYIEADINLDLPNATEGAFIATRIDKGGCEAFAARGVYFFLFASQKKYEVSGDLARTLKISEGEVTDLKSGWNNLGLLVKDNLARGTLNGGQVFNVAIPQTSTQPKNGFVGLGTSTFGLAQFDNVKIMDSSAGHIHMNKHKVH